MGQRNVWVRLSRYAAHSNLIEPELRAILVRINDLESWYSAWAERARHFEELGDRAVSHKHPASAAEYLLTASLLYHFAQINTRPENPRKVEGAQRSVACYRKAAPLFDPSAKHISFTLEDVKLPGYLRCPPGITRPPVVVLINGANSSKEELHPWTEVFLRRGLATVIFDGPGQGEMAPRHGRSRFRADDYDQAVATVLDWVQGEDYLNGKSIALWGMSLGGLLAAQAAARDRRVRAIVSVGGLSSLDNYANLSAPTQEEMRDLTGFQTLRETEAYFASAYNKTHLGPIACPFLVVHGALDEIVSTDEALRLAARAGDFGELLVLNEGVHCCYNLYQELRLQIADWVMDKLNMEAV